MLNIKKTLCGFVALLFCTYSFASSISNVVIRDDVIFFNSQQANLAACVDGSKSHTWAFSLNSENGPSLYRALLHAQASSLKITIDSTGECQDVQGYETPKAISVSYN
jgi:hypothetical protein